MTAAIIFLIGIIILVIFIVLLVFYIKTSVRRTLDRAGFAGMNIKNIVDEARLQDQIEPKSLASMDRIYLEQIKRDFPDININELKRKAEKVILDSFNSIEEKDSSKLHGKIKSFCDAMINDYKDKNVRFDSFKFHNTVVSFYRKEKGVATISFGSSFEYYLNINGNSTRTQDRAKTEFIYIYDAEKVPVELKAFGIHCPNCGSPITSMGEKSCSYCGSAIKEVIGKAFVCNDIVRY